MLSLILFISLCASMYCNIVLLERKQDCERVVGKLEDEKEYYKKNFREADRAYSLMLSWNKSWGKRDYNI